MNLADFPRPGPSIILGTDIVALYADAESQDFDGFSSVADIYFRFSKQFDFNTAQQPYPGTVGATAHAKPVPPPAEPAAREAQREQRRSPRYM